MVARLKEIFQVPGHLIENPGCAALPCHALDFPMLAPPVPPFFALPIPPHTVTWLGRDAWTPGDRPQQDLVCMQRCSGQKRVTAGSPAPDRHVPLANWPEAGPSVSSQLAPLALWSLCSGSHAPAGWCSSASQRPPACRTKGAGGRPSLLQRPRTTPARRSTVVAVHTAHTLQQAQPWVPATRGARGDAVGTPTRHWPQTIKCRRLASSKLESTGMTKSPHIPQE